jgi:hypothetical protein
MSESGPTDSALSRIRDELFRTGLNIDRALNLPPSPMNVERLAEMGDGVTVLILRQHWSQPDPDAALLREEAQTSYSTTFQEHKDIGLTAIANSVTRLPNPVRNLAAALVAMADDCDARMVIPVGIAILSTHRTAMGFPGPHRHAEVEISVTTVDSEWVRSRAGETPDVRDAR